MTNREDSVLDEIDRLVDWQMSGGDRSDSFHGEQYRELESCPWCREGWHFLPITAEMRRMRGGSYAVDEFGYGIVDPNYRYQDDDSPILCPGSEFHGPPDKYGTWDKQSRERAEEGSRRQSSASGGAVVSPTLPPGCLRRVRFRGPFQPWRVTLDDERIFEEPRRGYPGSRPAVVQQVLTATFELEEPLRSPSPQWVLQNFVDIADMAIDDQGACVTMKPIQFQFSDFEVYAESMDQEYPDWVEFTTTYPLERHPWFAQLWDVMDDSHYFTPEAYENPPILRREIMDHECCNHCRSGVWHHLDHNLEVPVSRRQGFESDVVIIDEAYIMNSYGRSSHVARSSRPPSRQAYAEAERRSAVFCSRSQAASSED